MSIDRTPSITTAPPTPPLTPVVRSHIAAEILSWPHHPHDLTPPRTSSEMRVRENVYARAECAAAIPLEARELPVVEGYAVVENGERMRDREVRLRSTTPLYTVHENNEYDVNSSVRVEYAPCYCVGGCSKETSSHPCGTKTNTLIGKISSDERRAVARRDGATMREEADAEDNSPHHPITLRAGDVAFDVDGRLCQLRWYYKHNSLQTSPYHFTENVDRHAMNWTPGCGLGDEICMSIPRPKEQEFKAHPASLEEANDSMCVD